MSDTWCTREPLVAPLVLLSLLKAGKTDILRRKSKALNTSRAQGFPRDLPPSPPHQISLWDYYWQNTFVQLLTVLRCSVITTQMMTTCLWGSQLVHTLWALKGSSEACFRKDGPRNGSCLSSQSAVSLCCWHSVVALVIWCCYLCCVWSVSNWR